MHSSKIFEKLANIPGTDQIVGTVDAVKVFHVGPRPLSLLRWRELPLPTPQLTANARAERYNVLRYLAVIGKL